MNTRWLFALVATLTLSAHTHACTAEMSVPTLADHAAQVIVAEVREVRSYWASDPRRIETELTLTNIEYLKGDYDGAPKERTLIVPGGTVEEWGMRLCCAPEYRAGERWVLFVLPTYKVHPVVGMERGSLRIERDANGVDRVRHADGRTLHEIDAQGMFRFGPTDKAHAHGAEMATTRLKSSAGVRLIEQGDSLASASEPQAMTLEGFRQALAPTLAASRDHHLRKPAGQRVPAEFRAVPLKLATPGASNEQGQEVTP